MTGHRFRVRFDPQRVLNRYAFALLRNAAQVHEVIFGQVRGATRPGYNTTLLGNVVIPLPNLDDQHQIVVELDALQLELDSIKRKQNQTKVELDAPLPVILDRAFASAL